MVLYISLTVVVVTLAFFIRKPCNFLQENQRIMNKQQVNNRIVLGAIFALLVSVSICRIAVGNDYWGYKQIFFLIDSNRAVSTEVGFNWVVRAMHFLFGSENYLVIFGLFGIVTIGFLIKAIVDQSAWVAASLFLLMTGGYYFSTMASVRYYFALAVGLYAAKYAIRKEWGRVLVILAITSLFHMSIWILLPIYYFATRSWEKWHVAILGALCISFLVFSQFYRSIIFLFYPYYEGSAFDTGGTSIVNIAKCSAILIFSLLYYKSIVQKDVRLKFYFNLNLFALILYVFCSFIPEISRIGYYMHITNIFLIPGILIQIKNKKQKIVFTTAIAAAYILYFAFFLHSCYDINVRLLPYLNWIFN